MAEDLKALSASFFESHGYDQQVNSAWRGAHCILYESRLNVQNHELPEGKGFANELNIASGSEKHAHSPERDQNKQEGDLQGSALMEHGSNTGCPKMICHSTLAASSHEKVEHF